MKIEALAFTPDALTQGLSVYCVGGAIRDTLLQQHIDDKDWVVVGASPEQMLARGFIPVGGHFPVFLHPHSKEEYALARTERKSGKGYQGFIFYTGTSVTLEEDLKRRDFTVNAMASDAQGKLYDPYGGLEDLRLKKFRHVSPSFMEDPLRILRAARLLSRFSDFSVDTTTMALCQAMVENKEIDALVPERIWKEISRALVAQKPSRCFDFLYRIKALSHLFPSFVWRDSLAYALDTVVQQGASLSQCYAVFSTGSEQPETLSTTLRIAKEQKEYAHYFPLVHQAMQVLGVLPSLPLPLAMAKEVLRLIEATDGFRKPERLLALVEVSEWLVSSPYRRKEDPVVDKVVLSLDNTEVGMPIHTSVTRWHAVLERLQQVQAGAIAQRYAGDVNCIKSALRKARLETLSIS